MATLSRLMILASLLALSISMEANASENSNPSLTTLHTQRSERSSKLSIKAEDLHADFSFESDRSDPSGRTVKFVDHSTGNPDLWCWTFGDPPGTVCDSEEKGPVMHPYPEDSRPRTYIVHLRVGRNNGTAETISETYKMVTVPIAAGPACSYQFDPIDPPIQDSVPAGGRKNNVMAIKTSPDCHWKVVSSDKKFLHITSSAQDNGLGSIKYDVTANPKNIIRNGALKIDKTEVTFAVTQDPASCSYAFDPPSKSFPAEGGNGNKVTVKAPKGCTWTAVSNNDFLQITSSQNSEIMYDVKPNLDHVIRNGTLKIVGTDATFTVTQDAATCIYKFVPPQPSASFPAQGSTGNKVSIETLKLCPVKVVVSNNDLLEITSVQSSDDSADVSYTVKPNLDNIRRNGSLTIDGTDAAFTITQDAATCTYAFVSPQPPPDSFLAQRSTGNTVTIETPKGCPWTVMSDQDFLQITSPREGSDSETLDYSVDTNPRSLSRTGALKIDNVDNVSFLVNQKGCGSIDRIEVVITEPEVGKPVEVNVINTPEDCAWIAESNDDFIKLESGATGSGNGQVIFSVKPTESQRDGTLSIAGNTVTVHQEGSAVDPSCLLAPHPAFQEFGAPGGIGSLQVEAGGKLSRDSTFLRAALDIDSGIVPFCVAANRHAQRSGFLAVSSETEKECVQITR